MPIVLDIIQMMIKHNKHLLKLTFFEEIDESKLKMKSRTLLCITLLEN